MILESKKRKVEKIKEKEAVEEMTNALDEQWKALIPVVGKLTNRNNERPKPDAYDRAMREMIFEPRGEPTDRLISAEALAQREKDRLERLERERVARMNSGGTETKSKQTHRSVEELDDGYFLNPTVVDRKEEILAYDVNEPLPDMVEDELEPAEAVKDDEADDNDEGSGEDDADEESEVDSLDDLRLVVTESSDDEEEIKSPALKLTNGNSSIKRNNQIPYTFEVPKKYEEFYALLESHASHEILVIERMIKCNHPKTSQEGNHKIGIILTYLLQYVDDLFSVVTVDDIDEHFNILERLVPQMYAIGQLNPENLTRLFKEVVREKHDYYKKKKTKCPTVETLVLFKLVSLMFPTSDFRHEVVTPCFIFMSQILTNMHVKTRADISRGLFLVTLCKEFTQMSKRFVPSAMNFLLGVLFLAVPKRPIELSKVIPPFKSKGPYSALLVITDDDNIAPITCGFMTGWDLILPIIDDDFKVRSVSLTVNLIHDICENLSTNTAATYYAIDFLAQLEKIPIDLYTADVKETYERTARLLTELANKPFTYLATEKRAPKPLRLIEPKFEKIYDGMKKFNQPESREVEEKQKLMHKIKRETKGAIREIRRDNEFIAKMQIKEQIRSDAERREKVKRIYSEASVQQGELNALDRSKSNKKKK